MAKLRRAAVILFTAAVAAGCVMAFRRLPGCLPLRAAAVLHDPRSALWAERAIQQESTATAAKPRRTPLPQSTTTPAPVPTPQPTPAKTQQPSPTPTAPMVTAPPGVESTAPILERHFGQGAGDGYITLQAGSIKNATDHPDSDLSAAVQGLLPFTVEPDSSEPQVLILHTHATECYQNWDELIYDTTATGRTKDTSRNVCAVGQVMTDVLNAAGITTLHDETLHDSPSYTESYARSAQTARSYLAKYPSIKVVLDVHRDAIGSGEAYIKPVAEVNGEKTAQVMIIAGCDNGSTVNLPNWRLNLRFAAAWEERMEALTPGLTRPVLCGYRFYNQDVCTGALLVEVGGHANTLEEAVRAGEYAASALAALLLSAP